MDNFYPSQVWRFCPYCGSQAIIWQNVTQRMCCQTCNKVFFINTSAAAVVIIRNNKGQVLFTRRKNAPAKDMLDLPGGFIDLGESAEDAVVREIGEELNIFPTEITYAGSFPNRYLYDGIVYFTLDLLFHCKVTDFTQIRAEDDVSDVVFLDPDQINIDEIGLESIKIIAQRIKDNTV